MGGKHKKMAQQISLKQERSRLSYTACEFTLGKSLLEILTATRVSIGGSNL
jgi:hypothetical protein